MIIHITFGGLWQGFGTGSTDYSVPVQWAGKSMPISVMILLNASGRVSVLIRKTVSAPGTKRRT